MHCWLDYLYERIRVYFLNSIYFLFYLLNYRIGIFLLPQNNKVLVILIKLPKLIETFLLLSSVTKCLCLSRRIVLSRDPLNPLTHGCRIVGPRLDGSRGDRNTGMSRRCSGRCDRSRRWKPSTRPHLDRGSQTVRRRRRTSRRKRRRTAVDGSGPFSHYTGNTKNDVMCEWCHMPSQLQPSELSLYPAEQ